MPTEEVGLPGPGPRERMPDPGLGLRKASPLGRLSRALGVTGRELVSEMGQESCSDKGNIVGVPH